MPTIAELIRKIISIRETIDMIEIKGKKNAELVLAAYNRCDDLIDVLNGVINSVQQVSDNSVEGGESNG